MCLGMCFSLQKGIARHCRMIGRQVEDESLFKTKDIPRFRLFYRSASIGKVSVNKKSVRLATQYIFDAKFTNELHTVVDANNFISQKLLERCGYKVRGAQLLVLLSEQLSGVANFLNTNANMTV